MIVFLDVVSCWPVVIFVCNAILVLLWRFLDFRQIKQLGFFEVSEYSSLSVDSNGMI